MKKIDRTIYNVLANQVVFCLCAFCKFSKCESDGYSPCDCGEPYCIHPLGAIFGHSYSSYGIEPGDDCWGFRPAHLVEFCADIVGILLQKGWQSAVWWQNKKGVWKITGVEA